MKKLILKTALITVGVTIILAVSLFGIISFLAPATMMRFCESLGLENIGADYAYQEYLNSKDLAYLEHAFVRYADNEGYAKADDCFKALYGEEGSSEREAFERYCAEQQNANDKVPDFDYRSYLIGRAACVKLHLAHTEDAKKEVVDFAISNTADDLSADSPAFALAIEAIDGGDVRACALLLDALEGERFNRENAGYIDLEKFLEEAVS